MSTFCLINFPSSFNSFSDNPLSLIIFNSGGLAGYFLEYLICKLAATWQFAFSTSLGARWIMNWARAD